MAFTFFFRDTQTLELLAQYAIPSLKQNQYIRIWDAGCAMGPEPYSVAIIFRENMGHFLFRNVKIYATDIDESDFGTIIAQGVYPESDVKRLPAEIVNRYFQATDQPGQLQISDEIRQAVQFQRHDLLSLQPPGQNFGLIVCKNVLLHFTQAERIKVMQMFHAALMDGGYFVSEQTQKLPPEIEPLFRQVTAAAQLYQKV